jgi:CRP-like cAMP-binding protein
MLNIIIPSLKLFQNIQTETLEIILSTAKIKTYKKGVSWSDPLGEYIACFYIMKGAIKLFKQTQEGKEIIIDILSKSHFFGEQQFFGQTGDPYWLEVIKPLQILSWPFDVFKKMLFSDHQLALNFLKNKILKQQELEHDIEDLTSYTAEQRIACLLLKLSGVEKKTGDEKIVLKLPYDKALIAAKLKMRPETFTRAMHKLCENCHIRLVGNILYIDSLAPLTNLI